MEEQYISFETAVLAKKKGFDEECNNFYDENKETEQFSYYHGDGTGVDKNSTILENDEYTLLAVCSAPTQSLLQKWLREEHNLFLIILFDQNTNNTYFYYQINSRDGFTRLGSMQSFKTYEEALEAGLFEALQLTKNE